MVPTIHDTMDCVNGVLQEVQFLSAMVHNTSHMMFRLRHGRALGFAKFG